MASDIPAFRHVLGSSGVLVPPGDAPALATRLVTVLRDPASPDARDVFSAAAAKFDWSRVVEAYREVYRVAAGIG